MGSTIASLLEIPPLRERAEIVSRDELGEVLGLPQRQALQLTRRRDFPEPMFSLHRREPAETLPQPQPIWNRSELDRWMKRQSSAQ
jgi:hypothetical protein